MENKKGRTSIVKLTFKAVGLAMAIATLVLITLGTATIETKIVMVTIGLLSLALAAV
ncbi:MAG: hypothetical protein P4L50_22155 [Anaerolineaceae bacterium]|nr:hypothetical protein [Anaerolineaceae bacterium]